MGTTAKNKYDFYCTKIRTNINVVGISLLLSISHGSTITCQVLRFLAFRAHFPVLHSVLDQPPRPHTGIFKRSKTEDGGVSERLASQDIFALQPKCKWQGRIIIINTELLCIVINYLLAATGSLL